VRKLWRQLRVQVGAVPLAALGLIAGGFVFLASVVRPLEARIEQLDHRLSETARSAAAGANATRRGTPAAQLAAFYQYFEREESQVDWLAKLYGAGRGAGVELRVADYRLLPTNGRIVRYQVTLPLAGSYTQLRQFLEDALDEIPVLSLDQLNVRRKRATDLQVEAEAVLTLHLLRP